MKISKVLILILALLSASAAQNLEQFPVFQVDYELSSFETQKFDDHIESRLPNYKKYFKKYSELYQVPWTLIAAVAYQESKWDEDARSHTGVRGLMQLTTKTAIHLGIDDREDPYESIRGGAFYLKNLFDKTPIHINSAQRWALALAAYNIGWGHLRDAHRLSIKLNKNPYNWTELKTVLPKLENEEVFSKLSFGYARGNETVVFVNKVFKYYQLLNTKYIPHINIALFNINPTNFIRQ